jgi:hypothetical protein
MSSNLNDYVQPEKLASDDGTLGWRIKRAPCKGAMSLLIYSHKILKLRTHWWKGRTGPCIKEGCEACLVNTEARPKGYVLALDVKLKEQILFEFTPVVEHVFEKAFKDYKTLRGLQIHALREGEKANSRVAVRVVGHISLPSDACPDYAIWPILVNMWHLKPRSKPILGRAENPLGYDDGIELPPE